MRIVSLLALVVATAPLPIGVELERLTQATQAGRFSEALRLLKELEPRLAKEAPLEVGDGQALAAPADGLGIYTPLAGGVVRGEELYLYAQVGGHGLRRLGEGWELHLVSDLVVLDAAGRELGRDSGFGASRFTARAPHRDTFVNAALRVKGLPPGRYVARLIVHDRVSEKSGKVDIPFAMP